MSKKTSVLLVRRMKTKKVTLPGYFLHVT